MASNLVNQQATKTNKYSVPNVYCKETIKLFALWAVALHLLKDSYSCFP